ncbi:MAG: hypothetical protein AAB453_01155, partial [Patescibacteria group bacterium]
MSQDMLGPVVRALVAMPGKRLGLVKDVVHKLGGDEGEVWAKQVTACLKTKPVSEDHATKTKPDKPSPSASLLELVGTVAAPATTSKFVAKEKFVVGTNRKAKVKISGTCSNFDAWFLADEGKVEDPIGEQMLRHHKLRRYSVDGPIITELGGEVKAETTLSEMFSLMAKQGNGEDGVLLNNGWANIFYVRDLAGVRRAVDVGWCGGGWDVSAGSVGDPSEWCDGRRVFSRNSDLKSSEPLTPA